MGQALTGFVILVVEDDYFIASDTAAALVEAGATVVGPCKDVDSAARLIEERLPSHVVLDLNLDHSGVRFDLVRELESRSVRSVIVFGYDQSVLPADLASVPFLTKPVSFDQLVDVLAALARRSPGDTETIW